MQLLLFFREQRFDSERLSSDLMLRNNWCMTEKAKLPDVDRLKQISVMGDKRLVQIISLHLFIWMTPSIFDNIWEICCSMILVGQLGTNMALDLQVDTGGETVCGHKKWSRCREFESELYEMGAHGLTLTTSHPLTVHIPDWGMCQVTRLASCYPKAHQPTCGREDEEQGLGRAA